MSIPGAAAGDGRRSVLLSGATGLVGGALLERLVASGRTVRALGRRPEALPRWEGVVPVGWDGVRPPAEALAGASAVVHLAGEPILGPPTAARTRRMRESRIDSTRALVDALGALPAAERPGVLVSASAIGYYGDRGEQELSEDTEPGEGFLARLCVDWEQAAAAAEQHGTRWVSLRIGVVLSRRGGALSLSALPFRLGLGARFSNGRQWFSWIHLADLVAQIERAIDDTSIQGVYNATAPRPVRNAEFTRALAAALHRPAFLRVPAFAIRAALGELAGELLGSHRVLPARALEAGFGFRHASLTSALAAELGREHREAD